MKMLKDVEYILAPYSSMGSIVTIIYLPLHDPFSAENGFSITVHKNEDVCLDCALESIHLCPLDIWYKLDCMDARQTEERRVFVMNKKLTDPVIRNVFNFSFNERDDHLYIPKVTYLHSGLYMRQDMCTERESFLYISYMGMSF